MSKGAVSTFDLLIASQATMTADLRAGIALLLLIAMASSASATGFTHVLNAGRYRIDVIVENPKSGQQQTVRQVERCLGSEAIANHVVFEMLSDTPASACPSSIPATGFRLAATGRGRLTAMM